MHSVQMCPLQTKAADPLKPGPETGQNKHSSGKL